MLEASTPATCINEASCKLVELEVGLDAAAAVAAVVAAAAGGPFDSMLDGLLLGVLDGLLDGLLDGSGAWSLTSHYMCWCVSVPASAAESCGKQV